MIYVETIDGKPARFYTMKKETDQEDEAAAILALLLSADAIKNVSLCARARTWLETYLKERET